MLSYGAAKQAKADRDMQRSLLVALEASQRSLRRDECGAWRIRGRQGHIYTWGPSGGWLIYVGLHSSRKWTAIKQHLSFCKVTQDGDMDGCLRLNELPTPEQATAMRKALGIKRKRKVDAVVIRERLLRSTGRGVSGAPERADAAPCVEERETPQAAETADEEAA
jgi:hypothetical protein